MIRKEHEIQFCAFVVGFCVIRREGGGKVVELTWPTSKIHFLQISVGGLFQIIFMANFIKNIFWGLLVSKCKSLSISKPTKKWSWFSNFTFQPTIFLNCFHDLLKRALGSVSKFNQTKKVTIHGSTILATPTASKIWRDTSFFNILSISPPFSSSLQTSTTLAPNNYRMKNL